jgi:dimethylamine--corrinoid protein Co-methyltransferase
MVTLFFTLGKIEEALQAQEAAAEYLTEDLVSVGTELADVGCKGLNFDTSGSAGDLVAWMQMTRKMKVSEAKHYMAAKLGIDILELTNEEVMRSVREDLGIGTTTSIAGSPKGIRAKWKVSDLLDIAIRSGNCSSHSFSHLYRYLAYATRAKI